MWARLFGPSLISAGLFLIIYRDPIGTNAERQPRAGIAALPGNKMVPAPSFGSIDKPDEYRR